MTKIEDARQMLKDAGYDAKKTIFGLNLTRDVRVAKIDAASFQVTVFTGAANAPMHAAVFATSATEAKALGLFKIVGVIETQRAQTSQIASRAAYEADQAAVARGVRL